MTPSPDCPQRLQLARLLAGSLTEKEQSELTAHLDHCSNCRTELEKLASGDEAWSETARRLQAAHTDRESEAALHDVLARLRAGETDTRSQTEPGQGVEDVMAYLRPGHEPGSLGQIAHYEIREVIGRGGMGVVFKAFDARLHRVVAIKVMTPALATSGSARQRFEREARAAAAVRNDHVIAIYAVDEQNGLPYLVMEYIAGRSLQERIDQTGPMQLKEILRIGLQTANGLAAAHAQGLIHRDIKPANILLENGVERVKITDFGLARAVDDASLTQSGFITGTPQYMSPEQASCESVDHRTDLFSLGSVLYAMCAGRPPFRASTTMGVLRQVSDETPRPIREINPDISERLAEIIAKLHAKYPAGRFQSAAEVAAALEQHLAEVQRPDWKRTTPPREKPARTEVIPPARRGSRLWTKPLRPRTAIYALLLLAVAWIVLVQYVDVIFFFQTGQLRFYGQVRVTEAPPDSPASSPPLQRRPAVTVTITPGPIPEIAAGAPLNEMALVSRPAPLPGVRSWTIETTHHRAAVEDVAYSPDGKWIATACRDGSVRVWRVENRRLVRLFTAPSRTGKTLQGLAWSPDSRYLATCQQDFSVQLWEVGAGRMVRQLTGLEPIYTVAWSPDGKFLAGAGWSHRVPIWEVASGRQLRLLKGHTGDVQGLAWSPDGRKLATGSEDKTARVWDAETGQLLHVLEGHHNKIKAVAFAPYQGGTHLATVSFDGAVRVWQAEQGICLHTLRGHEGEAWSVAWSPDGKRLASGGLDHTIRVWDPLAGKLLRTLEGHTHLVGSLSWSPDSQTLASGSWDTTVRLWSAGEQVPNTLPGVSAWSFNYPQWSPDGKYLATGARNARLWNAETGEQLHTFAEQCGVARAWSPDGKYLALTDWKGGVWTWENKEQTLHRLERREGKAMRAVAWMRNSGGLAVGNEKGYVVILSANGMGGNGLTVNPPPREGIQVMAVSSDGNTLASTGQSGEVTLWDLNQQKGRMFRHVHTEQIHALAWAPKSRILATGGEERVVRLWEADTGKVIRDLAGFHDVIWSLSFSPDGKTLAASDGWGDVLLFDPATGRLLHHLPGATAPLLSLSWSPDGKRLAGGGELSTTHIWNIAGGLAEAVLIGLPLDEALAVGGTGHCRSTPGVAKDLVYVVQTDKGQATLTPEAFVRKYHWQNDPQQVRPR